MMRRAARWVVILSIASADAKDVTVGTTVLALSPPPGFCELDAAQAADARMIGAIARTLAMMGNRLLSLSADCAELAEWRTGKRQLLDNLAQHQTMVSWENARLVVTPQTTIKQTCAEMRARGGQLVSDMASTANERIEEVLKTVKIDEAKFLGVLGEEPLVCYAALVQRTATEAGTEKTQLTVFATTIVGQKLIYYYRLAPYLGGETVAAMLEQVKADMRRLRRENPD